MAAARDDVHVSSVKLQEWLAVTGTILEVAGAATIVVGSVVALLLALARARNGTAEDVYISFRGNLARSILLGLELLVGGDIIRTITAAPSLMEVLVLAIVVLIRTLLSFTLQVEVEGHWPWEGRRSRHTL